MRARIIRASEYFNDKKECKTFDTLKELLDWQKEVKTAIIIELPVNGEYEITIYDDYIE